MQAASLAAVVALAALTNAQPTSPFAGGLTTDPLASAAAAPSSLATPGAVTAGTADIWSATPGSSAYGPDGSASGPVSAAAATGFQPALEPAVVTIPTQTITVPNPLSLASGQGKMATLGPAKFSTDNKFVPVWEYPPGLLQWDGSGSYVNPNRYDIVGIVRNDAGAAGSTGAPVAAAAAGAAGTSSATVSATQFEYTFNTATASVAVDKFARSLLQPDKLTTDVLSDVILSSVPDPGNGYTCTQQSGMKVCQKSPFAKTRRDDGKLASEEVLEGDAGMEEEEEESHEGRERRYIFGSDNRSPVLRSRTSIPYKYGMLVCVWGCCN